MERTRFYIQFLFTLLMNCRLWITRGNPIYTGPGKYLCLPGLNCYSCPAAVTSCPLGALQNFMATLRINLQMGQPFIGLYVLGSLGIVSSIVGRMPCAWLCPFGLLQELLFKIHLPKLPFWRPFRWGRYLFLILFVIILPFVLLDQTGYGQTWFCKYICPAGTLEAGIPLLAIEPGLRRMIGGLFFFKLSLLIGFIVWSMVTLRPFCRAVCPLGLILGFFNRFSWMRLHFHQERCVDCKACYRTCPAGLDFSNGIDPINSTSCIRCLRCVSICPGGAVTVTISKIVQEQKQHEQSAENSHCHQEQR